jgi:hypothetical protein
MVSVLASTVVDRGFESRSGQIKDYKIGICSNSAKHIALRRKRTTHLFPLYFVKEIKVEICT